MTKEEVHCPHCEAEFYIEHDDVVRHCACCGEPIELEELDFE